jgi:hypothetical protein
MTKSPDSSETHAENVQKVGLSHQSELLYFPPPGIAVAFACQHCLSDCYSLIQREVMCLETVRADRSQDFVTPCQNSPGKGRPDHFDAVI